MKNVILGVHLSLCLKVRQLFSKYTKTTVENGVSEIIFCA